jgi:hypothetical protein
MRFKTNPTVESFHKPKMNREYATVKRSTAATNVPAEEQITVFVGISTSLRNGERINWDKARRDQVHHQGRQSFV